MELGKPELPPFYSPGESFLRGFALMASINSRKQQLENQIQRTALENQALVQRTELAREKFGLDQERLTNLNDYRAQKLDLMTQHESRVSDIADRTLTARDQELKLREEKARAALEEQTAKLHAQRVGLFNKTVNQYGLPYDAFENPQNWQKRDDGKMFIEVPVRDKNGAQLKSDTETVLDPATKKKVAKPLSRFITLEPDTYQWLQGNYKDVKGDAVTPRAIESEQPSQSKVLDAGHAKAFLEQAGGDKQKARQLAVEAGYTF